MINGGMRFGRAWCSAPQLVLLHFLAFSIGLVKLVMAATHTVYLKIPFDGYLSGIFDWAAGAQLDKPDQLLAYGIPIGVLFVYFSLALWLAHQIENAHVTSEGMHLPGYVNAYLGGAFLLNFVIAWSGIDTPFILLLLWLTGFALLPVMYLTMTGILNWLLKPRFGLALLGAMLLHLGLIFGSLVFSPIFIQGDYVDIPEQTRLDARWVDNTQYINFHNIAGWHKYDPRADEGKNQNYTNATHVQIRKDPLLETFIKTGHQYKFHYDDDKGRLVVYGAMTPDELIAVEGIYDDDPTEKEKIRRLYSESIEYGRDLAERTYTDEEKEFAKNNAAGMLHQVKAGWFFHHHNYMFGAMNALAHGMPQSGVTMVYGWLNTVALGKALEATGGVNYQSYFSLMFSIYPIYYLLLGVISYLIFRKLAYVVMVMAGALGAMCLIGYPLTLMAPGFNPSRHFLDLIVFGLLYLHFNSAHKKWLYLVAALSVAGFFILWNKEFGFFALVAVLGALLYDGSGLASYWKRFLILLIPGVAGVVLYLLPVAGNNPGWIYMLLGVSGPPISKVVIFQVLLVIIFAYALLFRPNAPRNPISSLTVAVFLYCQLCLIYVIWFPAMHHVLQIAPALMLFSALLLRLLFMSNSFKAIEDRSVSALAIIVLVAFYLPASALMAASKMVYSRYGETHRIYDWNFENAQFRTTMDSGLFEEAVHQVKKYEIGDRMYLISKYDNLLPVLAGKYNDLPVMELATNLVTRKEVTLVSERIRKRAPAYLFMDTDIDRNLNGEIMQKATPGEVAESLVRVQILSKLKFVREALDDMYVPVDKGRLITVYQRKDLLP